MHCEHCKKEEETIKIAGKTYCANCSTILNEEETEEKPKHKLPKMEATDNEIRTEKVVPKTEEVTKEDRQLSRETNLPDASKDELGSSAILLDILSENAKEAADEETLEKDKKLEEASEEVIDLLVNKDLEKTESNTPKTESGKMMNDVKIKKRNDYQNKKHRNIVESAEEEIKDEAQKVARVVTSESGYTKEWDLMIMSVALTALALVILAIYVTFR